MLAALLFLALPFLFSQSASVAGARAAAWDGTARRGADRSAGLATALAVYATGLHRSPDLASQLDTAQLAYVQLPAQVASNLNYPSFIDNSWRTVLETGADWTDAGGATVSARLDNRDGVHGAIIEDESRRIDPNNLGERAWAVVLERAGIRDPYTIYWTWNPGPAGLSLAAFGRWELASYGRLARALSWWRPAQSRRFNRLEDLLGADPNEPSGSYGRTLGCIPFGPAGGDPATGAAIWPVPEATVEATRNGAESDIAAVKLAAPVQVGYRVAPLTQSELERLRPLLSFLVPGQGRSGIADYATVVAEEPAGWWGVVTDELDPAALGVGLGLRAAGSWARAWTGRANRSIDNGWLDPGDALAIDVPPALNINTVPAASRITALFDSAAPPASWPVDPWATPVTSIGGLGRLRWLDPRTGDGTTAFVRPPLGISGFGIVAIEGSATALDPQAHGQSQRRRRTVVQAVPQERPFEVAWRTQGELEGLVRQLHGSWVMPGPRPTARVANWGAQAGDMALLDQAGWLEPAPFCSFGRNPTVEVDWRVPFGLTGPRAWADILDETGSGTKPADAPVLADLQGAAPTASAAGRAGALTAQGLRIDPGAVLSYNASNTAGPLRFTVNGDEMGARHVSLRFCFPTAPGATAVILDARGQDVGHDASTPPDGIADDHSPGQSIWRVEYRPAQPAASGPAMPAMLVLVIANSALPWTAADRTRHGLDAWSMAADVPSDPFDARGNPDPALPFAPADPGERVEFRYVLPDGIQGGRWYHLQAFCASDRPAMHGLILDGVVGRDATQPGVDLTRTGDHYTFPSLRLATAVAATVPGSAGASALADPSTIAVQLPQSLRLADLLPPRGQVRIDDEYFRYTGLADGAAGQGTLTGVQRARRVNTDQGATEDRDGDGRLDAAEPDADGDGVLDAAEDVDGDGHRDVAEDFNGNGSLDTVSDFRRWPLTQRHEAGALVTPGWSQTRMTGGRWLHGAVSLVGPAEKPADALTPRPPLAKVPTTGIAPNPDGTINWNQPTSVDIQPIDWGDGQIWTWGDRGYAEFRVIDTAGTFSGLTGRCYFVRTGTTLALEWTRPLCGGGVWSNLPAGIEIRAHQISIEVQGDIQDLSPTSKRFGGEDSNANGVGDPGEDVNGSGGVYTWGALQILDPSTGRCEWIRTSERLDLAGAGRFFLHRGGGFDRDPSASPSSLSDVRGSMRTPWRQDSSWPVGSSVLPVQTDFFGSDVFESGDAITVVPETVGAAERPVQLVIRHAARDGYPALSTASGAQWDTDNDWFACTGAVPMSVLDPAEVPQRALVGRGWGGDDLSVVGNSPHRRGAMPEQALLAAGAGNPARLFCGGPDRLTGQNPVALIIDDLCAGNLSGPVDANSAASGSAGTTNTNASEIIAIGGQAAGSIGTAAAALPVSVQVSADLFERTGGRGYGLAMIDGEVFAWRITGTREAMLIARGLLGTAVAEHRLGTEAALVPTGGPPGSTRPVRPTLPIVILPMGPVAELCSPLPAGAGAATALDVVELPYTSYYRDPATYTNRYQGSFAGDPRNIMDPPVVLLHDPSGTSNGDARIEALRLLPRPASSQRTTAIWLRGLYGTADQAWTSPYTPVSNRPAAWVDQRPPRPAVAVTVNQQTAGVLNPIVIGWWPRFAPGMPATPTVEALRSRSFAWAGFPLRLAGARFDPAGVPKLAGTAGGVADVQVASDAGLRLEARALAAGSGASELFDWDAMPASARAQLSQGTNAALVTPFTWPRFATREVDGAELRIFWPADGTGAIPLLGVAAAQGRTPRLGASDAESIALPGTAIGSAAVRLRCMAPTRILAVEEVR